MRKQQGGAKWNDAHHDEDQHAVEVLEPLDKRHIRGIGHGGGMGCSHVV